MSFLTPEGLRLPTEFEKLERLRSDFEAVLGEEVDWSSDTYEGAFSVALARALTANSDSLQDIWDGLSLDTASGASLDVLGAFNLIPREAATFSTAEVSVTGDAGTLVPEGSVIEEDATGNRWVFTEDVTIPGTAVVSPQETGPIEAPANSLTEIITPISGWEEVTNPDPARRGRNRESDSDYRFRIVESQRGGTGSSRIGLQNELRALPFVSGSLVVHNPTSSSATVRGLPLNANSFQVIIFPDTLPQEQESQIFDRIIDFAPIGIESLGNEEDNRDGWPVRFSYADEVEVDIEVSLILEDSPGFSEAEIIAEVETRLARLIERNNIGEPVRILNVFGLLNTIQGVAGVGSLLIDGVASDFTPAANEFTVAGTISVSVV